LAKGGRNGENEGVRRQSKIGERRRKGWKGMGGHAEQQMRKEEERVKSKCRAYRGS
jgi:hypothetical protein